MKPLNNNVFIKRDKKADKTAGGIALPETKYAAENWCTVVAIGDIRDKKNNLVGSGLKEGSRVFVRPMDADKINSLEDENDQRCKYDRVEAVDVDGSPKPLNKRVFVEPEKAQLETTVGGIILAANVNLSKVGDEWKVEADQSARTDRGTVIAVADDVTDINVGDFVFFDKWTGTTLNEKTLILTENEILMVGENVSSD